MPFSLIFGEQRKALKALILSAFLFLDNSIQYIKSQNNRDYIETCFSPL